MTEETNQPQERQMTPEEIKIRKAEMIAYWKEDQAFLKAQVAHETLITELEELKARQIFAQVKIANLMAPPPQYEPEAGPVAKPEAPPTSSASRPRKLKTEMITPVVDPKTTTVA